MPGRHQPIGRRLEVCWALCRRRYRSICLHSPSLPTREGTCGFDRPSARRSVPSAIFGRPSSASTGWPFSRPSCTDVCHCRLQNLIGLFGSVDVSQRPGPGRAEAADGCRFVLRRVLIIDHRRLENIRPEHQHRIVAAADPHALIFERDLNPIAAGLRICEPATSSRPDVLRPQLPPLPVDPNRAVAAFRDRAAAGCAAPLAGGFGAK